MKGAEDGLSAVDHPILLAQVPAEESSGMSSDSLIDHFCLQPGQSHDALLAEDGFPWLENPLNLQEDQAYVLEIPLKPRDIRKWLAEDHPLVMAHIASAGKRARVEVSIKNLSAEDRQLFAAAKQKELTC